MNSLKHYCKIYLLLFVQNLKGQMQFRTDFWISQFAILLQTTCGYFGFWILFHSITRLSGWNFYELTFIFGVSSIAIGLHATFFGKLWSLDQEIITGSFIICYFRPVNMLFYYISSEFGFISVPRVVFGMVALIYSSIYLHLHWTILNIFLLIIFLLSAGLVMSSIMLVTACLGFWTLSNSAMMHFSLRLGDFAKYPITIYNTFFRFLFTFVVPIGFVAFYPAQLFLRPEKANLLVYLSPVLGIISIVLAYQVWRVGVKNYSGTGT